MAEQILTILPYFEDDDGTEAARFWARVAEDPNMVVMVEPALLDGHEPEPVSVFSTYARALEYAKAIDHPSVLIVPKRIDEPTWGNTEVN